MFAWHCGHIDGRDGHCGGFALESIRKEHLIMRDDFYQLYNKNFYYVITLMSYHSSNHKSDLAAGNV